MAAVSGIVIKVFNLVFIFLNSKQALVKQNGTLQLHDLLFDFLFLAFILQVTISEEKDKCKEKHAHNQSKDSA